MLSYADRMKALRETKIRHTFEKREQNGFQNADDYGTVPLPENYGFMPYFNSDNAAFYGYTAFAENFARMVEAHGAYVDPMEMLCCRWRDMLANYRGSTGSMAKLVMDNEAVMEHIRASEKRVSNKGWDEKNFPFDDLKPYQRMYDINTGIESDSHLACDYRIGFELGFGGMLDKIEKYRKQNPGKDEFYDAEKKCVEAIIGWVDKHIEEIDRLIAIEQRPELRESLKAMKTNCEAIRTEPPQTFYQVCQWVAFFVCASRIYTRDGAGFQIDTLLYPYYERDVKAGILDDETAKFIIANLLLIDPHYYQISGVDAEDRDMTNKLSWLILEAADMLNASCNITVRVHKNCDPAFLRKSVEYLFKNKNGWPRFCGDKALLEGYMKNGVDKASARERIAVGCNWMALPGREFPMNDCVKINVAKVLEQALKDMKNEENKSSERLFELWEEHLKKAVDITAKGVRLHLENCHKVTPELVMNLMFHGSLETGEDCSVCAEFHTIGLDGAGLAVVADSLGAIEARLEKEKLLDWEALYKALDDNFADERIHLMMKTAPKYCEGGTASDRWAERMRDSYVKIVCEYPLGEGMNFVPGWFSWSNTISFGKAVGATPNGRRAGEPITHGANPTPGFRRDGAATAQSNGIAAVQCGRGNTAPLQIEFDPKITAEEGGVEAVCALIREHFERGGTLININILDADKLKAAHENPDLFPELVVRVTGFTAYFVSLTPDFRQLVVDRFVEGM